MNFTDTTQEKILPIVMKFVNLKPVQAIKDGMLFIMPLSIVGSLFLLFAEFPYAPVKDFFANIGWAPAMYQANNATMGIMALVAVIAIAHSFAKNEGVEPLGAGFTGLSAFLLLLNWNIPVEEVEGGVAGIATNWVGSEGVVAAIIIGVFVGYIYTWLLKKGVRIKLPETVPSGVANSFNALIPLFIVVLLSAIIYGILGSMNTSFLDLIYTTLQIPLQGLSDSVAMAVIHPLTVHFLWWFGIHGAVTVGGIVEPILRTNLAGNAALYRAGELSLEKGGHILTVANTNVFMTPTGSGMTFGIVFYMLFSAKSEQYKALGKLAIGSSLFNINEPIIFGTPIVMNPLLFLPFVLVPMIGHLSGYFLIRVGILPMAHGIEVPWTTPPIIQGLLAGGWKWALFQVVLLAMSVVVYFPFIRAADQQAYAQEQADGELTPDQLAKEIAE